MKNLKELYEERGALSKKMHSILDGAEDTLSAEQQGEYDAAHEEYRAVCDTIVRAEAMTQIDSECAETVEAETHPEERSYENMTEMERRAADYERRAATGSRPYSRWLSALAKGESVQEYRSDETLISNNSVIMDKQFSYDVIRRANELCDIADKVSTVYARGTYSQIISKVNSDTDKEYIVNGGWVAENAAFGRSDIRYDTIDIKPYKYGREVLLSLEIMNQHTADLNLAADIVEQYGRAFAIGKEQGIIKGTGDLNGQPTGLVTGGATFDLPATGVITADNLIQIYHALKSYYTHDACWVMNRQTLAAVRMLKDSTGAYIFKPNENFAYNFVGSIFGKEVLISEEMDSLAANVSTTAYGADAILYGDFRSAYRAIQNPDISIQYLDQLHALNGGVGILGIMWLGGKVVNNEAYVRVRVDKATG